VLANFSTKTNEYKYTSKLYAIWGLLVLFCEAYHIINFVTDNFAYQTVFEHSSIQTPFIYKLAATYTGSGGSFLLWLTALTLIGFAFNRLTKSMQGSNYLRAMFMLLPIFLTCALSVNSPFELLLDAHPELQQIPTNGFGLKPILQSPYNLLHPPLLFIGFSFLYITWCITFVLLFLCKDKTYNFSAYIYLLAHYCRYGILFLFCGTMLGSLWAYYSLGWGGFWGWDPIENAALIPLLLSFALLHSAIIYERKGELLKTTIVLGFIIFPTILFCTFIARSGILQDTSIHTYVESYTTISLALLSIILLVIMYSLILFVWRLKTILQNYTPSPLTATFSQPLITGFGIIIIILLAFTIFIGTIMPIISNVWDFAIPLIGADFFIQWCLPLMIVMFILLGIAYTMTTRNMLIPLLIAVIVMAIAFYSGVQKLSYLLAITSATFAISSQVSALYLFRIKRN
jgi:cytochrome c-type biogenesis protein CcmF